MQRTRAWRYWAFTGVSLAAGAALGALIASPLPNLLGVVCGLCCFVLAIWRCTGEDPIESRVEISASETTFAEERLTPIDDIIAAFAVRAGVKALRATRHSNHGVYYHPILHRVFVSRAACARLDEEDLRVILAHEVGHATKRHACLFRFGKDAHLNEEVRADKIALQLAGATKDDWVKAVEACDRAEGRETFETSPEMRARLAALTTT